jgi:hypothetical protein
MERKLRYFEMEMKKENIKIHVLETEPTAMHLNEMFPFEVIKYLHAFYVYTRMGRRAVQKLL